MADRRLVFIKMHLYIIKTVVCFVSVVVSQRGVPVVPNSIHSPATNVGASRASGRAPAPTPADGVQLLGCSTNTFGSCQARATINEGKVTISFNPLQLVVGQLFHRFDIMYNFIKK